MDRLVESGDNDLYTKLRLAADYERQLKREFKLIKSLKDKQMTEEDTEAMRSLVSKRKQFLLANPEYSEETLLALVRLLRTIREFDPMIYIVLRMRGKDTDLYSSRELNLYIKAGERMVAEWTLKPHYEVYVSTYSQVLDKAKQRRDFLAYSSANK